MNWAVLAEHRRGAARDVDHVVLLWLGPGLGAGTLADGAVVRGGRGLAGEIAHVVAVGPDGHAMPLQEVFRTLGLLVAGTDAIDVDAVRALVDPEVAQPPTRDDRRQRAAIVVALAGVVRTLAAVADPELVLLGGPWGGPHLAGLVGERVRAEVAVPPRVDAATLGADAPAVGLRHRAVALVRSAVTATAAV